MLQYFMREQKQLTGFRGSNAQLKNEVSSSKDKYTNPDMC